MFTSKKAQYLDNYFGKISPITNIDSLYYEQAIVDPSINSSIGIYRKSVVKNMPVQMKFYNTTIYDITLYNESNDTLTNNSIINVFPTITYLRNFNGLQFPLFTIESSTYIDLQNILSYYTPKVYFDSSVNYVNSLIDDINSSVNLLNSSINDVSINIHNLLENRIHNTLYTADPQIMENLTDSIHGMFSVSRTDGYDYGILVQGFGTQSNNNVLMLQQGYSYNKETYGNNIKSFTNDINYFINGNDTGISISYIKDLNNNEVFNNDNITNASLIEYTNSLISNNSFNNIITNPSEGTISDSSNNTLINVENITLNDTYNNTIINSKNTSIYKDNRLDILSYNNEIINCSSYKISIVGGKSNLLINCNNSSIYIIGNNNILINVENQNITIDSNNIIINDFSYADDTLWTKILNNSKFFFNNSVSTGIVNNLSSNVMIFGGQGNDVSVYANIATF